MFAMAAATAVGQRERASWLGLHRPTAHYQSHVVETALAHSVGNAVDTAYRRGDLFGKLRSLMANGKICSGARPVHKRHSI